MMGFSCSDLTVITTLLQKYSNSIKRSKNRRKYKHQGKRYSLVHIHSIVKKKRIRDERLKREYPPVWSNFSLEAVDKTLVMSLSKRLTR